MRGALVIFSGLPGSGKSTLATRLASHLRAVYLRIDTLEQGLRDICGMSKIDGKGYDLAHRVARENLRLGNTVIADSVNPWPLTREAWNKVAEEAGVPFINIEVACSDNDEHKRRIETRGSSVPGLKLPTWKEVTERDYRPWDSHRIQLNTSGKSIENCVQDLLMILAKNGFESELK